VRAMLVLAYLGAVYGCGGMPLEPGNYAVYNMVTEDGFGEASGLGMVGQESVSVWKFEDHGDVWFVTSYNVVYTAVPTFDGLSLVEFYPKEASCGRSIYKLAIHATGNKSFTGEAVYHVPNGTCLEMHFNLRGFKG
jgi:hypothetical protein